MSANQTSWANRVKKDLSATPTTSLKRVNGGGDLAPINTYYQFTAPKNGAPETARQLNAGEVILGTYNGSFTTKKFGTTYHKVQTSEGLVAIPGSGQLNSLMKKVPSGAEVQIVYEGKQVIKRGNYAGKMAHSFLVNASEVIAA